MKRFDVAISGSGLAGLSVALHLADHRKVGVFTKRELRDGASNWAQGGIAAVLAKDDSPADHIRDTETGGAGLCNPEITRYVVEHGRPDRAQCHVEARKSWPAFQAGLFRPACAAARHGFKRALRRSNPARRNA